MTRKSSYSNGGACVEVAVTQNFTSRQRKRLVLVRDSKVPQGPILNFSFEGWHAFTEAVKGETSIE